MTEKNRKFYVIAIMFISALAIVNIGNISSRSFADPMGVSTENPHPGSFADLVEGLLPAVVNISSKQKTELPEGLSRLPEIEEERHMPFDDFLEEFMDIPDHKFNTIPQASLGSGFIVDAENGIIVTNNHVIRNADEVEVTFYDDESVTAEVLGRDDKTDIAVLKVKTDKKLTELTFGNSDVLRVGDWVLAIGNPFGLGGTVTAGIISARQRNINAGPYDDFLQTDASINKGNSGGPMFNLDGEVIGINTAIFSPSGGSVGIGFAIPSALAKPVIDQIIKYGKPKRGWLGVHIQTVTEEIAQAMEMKEPFGALIASVTPDSPAEEAGMKTGDVIIEFNSDTIEKMNDLPRIVAETEVGSKADVKLLRNGKTVTLKVNIGEMPDDNNNGTGINQTPTIRKTHIIMIADTGLGVSDITPELAKEYMIDEKTEGVLVTEVQRGSEAFDKSIAEGDIILSAEQRSVSSAQDLQNIADSAAENGKKFIMLLINREGSNRFTALKIAK